MRRNENKRTSKDGSFNKKDKFTSGDNKKRSFSKDGDKKSFRSSDERGDKRFEKREDKAFDKKRPFNKDGDKKSFRTSDERGDKRFGRREDSPFEKKRSFSKDGEKKDFRFDDNNKEKPFGKREDRNQKTFRASEQRGERSFDKKREDKPFSLDKDKKTFKRDDNKKPFRSNDKRDKSFEKRGEKSISPIKKKSSGSAKRSVDGKIRLNRFLSQAGICSRREADVLIATGIVQINNKIVTELGLRVNPQEDVVKYDGKIVKVENLRYVVLNKPKDFITTSKDPQNRKTVMHLVENACVERIYPVGRLDRNTLGVLLFTNDGNLAEKLTHPRSNIAKTYLVETNKKIEKDHMDALIDGIELEDGIAKVDEIHFIDPSDKKAVSVTIHSGKNRIVRRMFEHFGYEIKSLDRVDFGGITKKGLKRGEWRILDEKEVGFLNML